MRVGGITSTSNMPAMQMTPADLKDQKSKSIQHEITSVQQQMQTLSSEEELSANEKADERKKLQKEISDLNTELKRHQEELGRTRKREIMLSEMQEDKKPEEETETEETESEGSVQAAETSSEKTEDKTQPSDKQQPLQPGTVISKSSDGVVILKEVMGQNGNQSVKEETEQAAAVNAAAEEETETAEDDTVADSGLSDREVNAMVYANSFMQQANRLGALVTKTEDGIAVLKGEIKQDQLRDTDTERKDAELKDMQKQQLRETAFQFSMLRDAGSAMKAAESDAAEKEKAQADVKDNAYASAMKATQETQAQQRFYVSFG